MEAELLANLTLAIDDELLQRARQQAVKEKTSVNALIRNHLSHYVDSRSRRLAALSAFESVASTVNSASDANWSRDSLHERN